MEQGKYEEAILAFEKAINIDTKNIDARLSLSKAYLMVNKPLDAEKVLREAVDIDPVRAESYAELSKLFIRQGRTREAIKLLEKGYEKTKNEELKKCWIGLRKNQVKLQLRSLMILQMPQTILRKRLIMQT